MNRTWRFSLPVAAVTLGLTLPLLATPAQAAGSQTIQLWTHNGGNKQELADVNAVVKAFNASHKQYKVVVKAFPQINYNDAVVAAAASKQLPCLLDSDAPVIPAWAYAGYLAPLNLDPKVVKSINASAKGMWKGKLYSFGMYDAVVGLVTRKSTLAALGLRTPSLAKPWTLAEFNNALAKAKASGKYQYAIDLGTGWDGEWYPYGFSPFLQSFGGDLINRKTYRNADNVLNGGKAVAFGTWFQGLFANGYAPKRTDATMRDNGLVNGSVAFSWNFFNQTQFDALKGDMIVLPPPNLGVKPVVGGGSWQWAMSSSCNAKTGANAFLKFMAQTKYFKMFSDTLSNLPVTAAATKVSKVFGPGTDMNIAAVLSAKYAVIRPPTPAYPVIAKVFEAALKNIINGADVQSELDNAVNQIDQNLQDNHYYGF